jgi:uncharacterized membrane protein HdeD (DUF308 family)
MLLMCQSDDWPGSDLRQDPHRGKEAICTAGVVGILTGLFSLLSMYNCPATSITAVNTITNIALASCVTSFIQFPGYH